MVLAVVVLILLVGATIAMVAKPTRAAAVVVAALGLAWILANHPLEGPVLLILTADHGITLADLLSVAAWALAVAAWFGLLDGIPTRLSATERRQRRNR